MSIYLNQLIMPNGSIPLINDSTLDYPFLADWLLQVSSAILGKKLCCRNSLSNYALGLLNNELKEI